MKHLLFLLIILSACNRTPKKYAIDVAVHSSDGNHSGDYYYGCEKLSDHQYRYIRWNKQEKRMDTTIINIKPLVREE